MREIPYISRRDWALSHLPRSGLLCALACLAASLAVRAGTGPGCAPEIAGRATVAAVIDAQTLQLDDGSSVRLTGALPPQTPPWWKEAREWPPGIAAKNFLAKLASGKRVRLHVAPGETERDRHDRLLAQVLVVSGETENWVQGDMVNAGFARTYSFPGHKACARDLQAREDSARRGKRGLWREDHFSAHGAEDYELLLKRRGSFQLVEGLVVSVGKTRNWTYLNFSRDWRRDFTVAIAAGNRKNFEGQAVPLELLEGKRVRVRGWIESWNGPVIKASHAEQIEILP